MFCPSCRAEAADRARFCHECGTVIPAPRDDVFPPTPGLAGIRCPRCRSVDVAKLSGVVQRGITEAGFIGSTVHPASDGGHSQISSTSGVSTGISALARALAKPRREVADIGNLRIWVLFTSFLIGGGLWLWAFLALVGIPGHLWNPELAGFLFLAGLVVTIALSLWLRAYEERKDEEVRQRTEPIFLARLRAWDSMYYCPRDDVAFDPSTGVAITSAEFQAWLKQVQAPAESPA